MVGILVEHGDAALGIVRQAVETLPQVRRTVIIQNNGTAAQGSAKAAVSADLPSDDEQPVIVLPWTLRGTSVAPVENLATAYQSVLAAGEKLGVQAACVVASDLQTVTSQWISSLVQPVLQLGFDLVTPRYAQDKFDGLLNKSLISPLHRALYGIKIQSPMGPDMSMSRRLFQRILESERERKLGANRAQAPASIGATALCGGFKICQAHLGVRVHPPVDWNDLSSVLVQVLGPIFLDLECNAACWQRPREPVSPLSFGERSHTSGDERGIDVARLLESFRLGARDLLEVWGLILPPTTLFELRKLSRLPQEQFRLPDELWARIVYDFALGHRVRTISRDHLLRAMTPLYLGWVASYALEMESASVGVAEQRLERLCQVFETAKSYLVSRWRWPDRFNP